MLPQSENQKFSSIKSCLKFFKTEYYSQICLQKHLKSSKLVLIGYFRFENVTSGSKILRRIQKCYFRYTNFHFFFNYNGDSTSTSENYVLFWLKSTTDPYFRKKFWFSTTSGYERDFFITEFRFRIIDDPAYY